MHPETPSDPERRSGEIPSGAFTYTEEGEGPALVALHGLPGSARDFRWLGAALPPTLRFIRLELPGFGSTPRTTEPRPDILSRAAFVIRALDALEIDTYTLLGHSMGGTVALAVAAKDLDRCRSLALLASAGLRPHRLLRRAVPLRPVAGLVDHWLLGGPTTALIARVMGLFGFPASIPRSEFAHATRCVTALEFALQRTHSESIRQRTLAAWSEDDPLIERAVFEEHAARLPPGPRLVWSSGGHNIQKTRATELAGALVELCRTGLGPGDGSLGRQA